MILIPSTEVMLSDIVPIRKGKSRGSTKKDSKKTTKLKSFNPVWGDASKKDDKVSEDLANAREMWGPPKKGKPKTNYLAGVIGELY